MSGTLITLIVVLLIVGVCLGIFRDQIDPKLRQIIYVLIALLVILTLLYAFGILGGGSGPVLRTR